jgi:predicted nucleotidyltransferase
LVEKFGYYVLFFSLGIACILIYMKAQDLQLPIELRALQDILRAHGVITASIFGSYARGEAHSSSDLDILVNYKSGISLFDHIDLKDELERFSGMHVDVVSERALSRHIKPFIDKEKIAIL